jgi:hypothetical protein
MLTTIGLILAAYLIQESLAAWSRRRRRYYQPQKGSVRHNLAIGSLVSLVIIGGIAVSLATPNQKPGVIAFLGTVYPDGYSTKIPRVSDYFQINGQKPASQPTYVFLHPGTPTSQIKPPKARRLRRPRPS